MVVVKIQDQVAAYKKWLSSLREHPNIWWWESQQVFQDHWQPDAPDPVVMFDQCFQNSVTRRLWQSDTWRPREMMRLFYKFDPGMVKAMFDDLFNETKAIDARISRFLFGLDTLLADYKKAHPSSVDNNHYHDDYRMIALYLGFRYPDQYAAPYDLALFTQALAHLGARELPQENDIGRFFKMHRTIMTFIDKEPAIDTLIKKHLDPRKHFTGRSILLAVDFTQFVAKN
jgi:hypothetical protein